jgi:AAHS family benzoate transporter-like MFS transporter
MQKVFVNRVLGEGKFNIFHWMFLILCFLIVTFEGYDLVVYGASVPLIMKYWFLKPAYAGVIGTYALFGAALGSLCFGRLADKIGRKKTILICTTLFSVCMIVCAVSPDPIIFGVFRVLSGIGIGGAMPNVVALATEWTPVRHRSLMVTAIYTGMQWGGILAAGIGIWLLPLYGWRSLYLFGGITILLLPFLLGWLPETAPRLIATGRIAELIKQIKRAQPEVTLPAGAEYDVDKTADSSPLIDVFRQNRGLSSVCFIIVYFTTLYMIYGLNIWLPKLMMNAGYPLGSALTFLLVLNLGCFILNIFTAAIADKIGPRKMVLISYFLGFFVIASLSMKTNIWLLYLLVALAGVFTMGAHNIVHAYVSQFYPPSVRSTGLGLCFGLGRIGAVLGPILGGVLMQMHVTIFVSFLAFAIPSMISFVAFFLTQDKYSYTTQAIAASKAQQGVGV